MFKPGDKVVFVVDNDMIRPAPDLGTEAVIGVHGQNAYGMVDILWPDDYSILNGQYWAHRFALVEQPKPAPPVVKVKPRRYVVRHNEKWVGKGHVNTRKHGTVTAVRVAKGDVSGRGGQFHGATNFPEISA